LDTTISVVIPTFNRGELLSRALNSILSQTFPPYEVIIVDDGSLDNTADIIKTSFPTVAYLYQKNSGVSAARNCGINSANGEWIAFLDSDDEWHPVKLQKQMEAVQNNPESKICHTEEIWVRNGKRVHQMDKHKKFGGWIFQKCIPLCCISPSSVMIHRSVFDEVGLFDESLPVCEDYDMWLRITSRYPVLFLDELLITKFGGHADQLSRKYWGMDRFRIKSLENILFENCLSEENKEAILNMMIEKINIFLHGARKRKNMDLTAKYEEKLHRLNRFEMVN
tara:strand:+ start:5823 stop:6665 length:843 start_codon:yes stop_codon:yes gene_type:complete